MARQEKGTRIKGTPANQQSVNLNCRSGSFPTVRRTASDNRTGHYAITFDDSKTINVNSSSNTINYPLKLEYNDYYTAMAIESELLTNITTYGTITRGALDDFLSPWLPGQELEPYKEVNNIAAESTSSFFATGSSITDAGFGFQQPLKSKTKIEFDLTPQLVHSFSLTNFTSASDCYPMAYWNKTQGRYVGVGSGLEPINFIGTDETDTSPQSLKRFLEAKGIGFGATLSDGIPTTYNDAANLIGNPISNFGFPNHEKFSGSADNIFPLSQLIKEPFLLEKIVVYTSASFLLNGFYTSALLCANTFFILNQRNYPRTGSMTTTCTYISGNAALPAGVLSFLSSSDSSNTHRDLVTWVQVAREASSVDDTFNTLFNQARELLTSGDEWSGQLVISGTVKNPIAYTGSNGMIVALNFRPDVPDLSGIEFFENWHESGRNNLGDTGRNWTNTIVSPMIAGTLDQGQVSQRGGVLEITTLLDYKKHNPYILLPTDNLIFGWQLPTSLFSWNYRTAGAATIEQEGPSLTFATGGVHKVILYGSHIRVNDDGDLEEFHDTLNQLLTSDAIHEVVGE